MSGHVFSRKTEAPARNADPSRMIILQNMVAGEYHPGRPKNVQKNIALVTPKQRGSPKIKILSQYQGPGVRAQGPAGYHFSQIRPRSIQIWPILWLKSGQGGQKCCGTDFGSRKKISGYPLGRSAWFFEIYLDAAARIPKIR